MAIIAKDTVARDKLKTEIQDIKSEKIVATKAELYAKIDKMTNLCPHKFADNALLATEDASTKVCPDCGCADFETIIPEEKQFPKENLPDIEGKKK